MVRLSEVDTTVGVENTLGDGEELLKSKLREETVKSLIVSLFSSYEATSLIV